MVHLGCTTLLRRPLRLMTVVVLHVSAASCVYRHAGSLCSALVSSASSSIVARTRTRIRTPPLTPSRFADSHRITTATAVVANSFFSNTPSSIFAPTATRLYSQNYRAEYDDDTDQDNEGQRRRRRRSPKNPQQQQQQQQPQNMGRSRYSSSSSSAAVEERRRGQRPTTTRRRQWDDNEDKAGNTQRSRNTSSRGSGRGERNPSRRNTTTKRNRNIPSRPQRDDRNWVPPLPPLQSRPTYFTCRHTYEDCLEAELRRAVLTQKSTGDGEFRTEDVLFSRPHPGVVMILSSNTKIANFLSTFRPMYALQIIPNCVLVQADSIKGLARVVLASSVVRDSEAGLRAAPQGSLALHALLPEMGRGMPEAQLKQYRRVTKIGEELATQLKKQYKAARKPKSVTTAAAASIVDDTDGTLHAEDTTENAEEKWILQILLLEPQIVAASLTQCAIEQHFPQTTPSPSPLSPIQHPQRPHWTWPNWKLPAGLALVDLPENTEARLKIPSSAYRKLLEAFWYLGERPPPAALSSSYSVIDLGACPGGWTSALRYMDCTVIAVDRSVLDPSLMQDYPHVEYVAGDAFRFVPPWITTTTTSSTKSRTKDEQQEEEDPRSSTTPTTTTRPHKLSSPIPNTWMVSDIIAYPDKIAELLDTWCGNNWISHTIVTIKFQGNEIPWNDVERIATMVQQHEYSCRTVHFFNNKNEVTFMAIKNGYSNHSGNGTTNIHADDDTAVLLGKPMYPLILPIQKKQK